MKKNNYTLMELFIVLGILIVIPTIIIVVLFVIHPPVNYEDYNAERNQKIEEIQKIQEKSF